MEHSKVVLKTRFIGSGCSRSMYFCVKNFWGSCTHRSLTPLQLTWVSIVEVICLCELFSNSGYTTVLKMHIACIVYTAERIQPILVLVTIDCDHVMQTLFLFFDRNVQLLTLYKYLYLCCDFQVCMQVCRFTACCTLTCKLWLNQKIMNHALSSFVGPWAQFYGVAQHKNLLSLKIFCLADRGYQPKPHAMYISTLVLC